MTHTIYYTASEFGASINDTTFHRSKDAARAAGRAVGLVHVLEIHVESDESVKHIGFSLGAGASWNGEDFIKPWNLKANPDERENEYIREVQE